MSDTRKRDAVRLGPQYLKLWTANVVSNLGDGIGLVAYPWLASAVTRNPLLIAAVGVAQRLPWLVFSLPAGVITDRVDRRRLILVMDVIRTGITLAVGFLVLAAQDLPSPEQVASGVVATNTGLYVALLVATLLFGFAEVLRDNSAQTLLPAIVEPEGLEKANGRMWAAEMVANSFAGPPLGSLLIGVLFALPFFVDAATFAVSAGLIFMLTGDFRSRRTEAPPEKISWKREIGEGFRWLWGNPMLRTLAIVLGWMNGLFNMAAATLVLFAQEVLNLDAFLFALLGTGAAIGGVLGSITAPRISRRLGSGPSLYLTLISGCVTSLVIAATSSWPVTWLMFGIGTATGMVWNVITVSLRQTIIPDQLLGRVNSVYRFFGWGTLPIGLGLGGALVWLGEILVGREFGLRLPWFVTGVAYAILFIYAAPRLTTTKIETARTEGLAAKTD
jgi:MFS family permease